MSYTEIRNKNHVVAYRAGDVVAEARRTRPGNLWRVWFYGRDGTIPPDPAVRVSGHLPEVQQRKLVLALLEINL